jgi:transposase
MRQDAARLGRVLLNARALPNPASARCPRPGTLGLTGTWKLTIVQRNELHRFVVLPKRWIVEPTLAWISHSRRLARDFERHARSAAAFIRLAMIRIMLRRLTNPTLCS